MLRRWLWAAAFFIALTTLATSAYAITAAVLIGAIASGAGAAAAGITVFGLSVGASALLIGASSLLLSGLQSILAPKPKARALASFEVKKQDQTTLIRQPITHRRIVFGEQRVSGPLIFIGATSNNGFHHLVIPLADHQVKAIETIYFGDEAIFSSDLDSGGNVVSGKFSGVARIKKHLGSENQVADADLVSEVTKWTTSHIGNGVAYIYVRTKTDRDKFPNVIPGNISAWVKGAYLYDPRAATISITSSSVGNPTTITTADPHGLVAEDMVYITGHTGSTPTIEGKFEVIAAPTSTTFTIRVNVTVGGTGGTLSKMLWSPNPSLVARDYLNDRRYGRNLLDIDIQNTTVISSANSCEEFVTTLTVSHTVNSVDTANDILELDLNDERLEFQTGDRAQVTTTGTLPGGVVAVTDYFIIQVQERSPLKIKLATTYDNALAGVALDITSVGSGTHTVNKNAEPRFTCNGVMTTDQLPHEIIDEIRSSMAGRIFPAGATWRILAGVFTASTVTLDEGDLRGQLRRRGRHSRRNRHNAIKGLYSSPLNNGQPDDYPPVTSAAFEAEDNGEQIFRELDLTYTSRSQTAQRIAKIELLRHRRQTTVESTWSLAAFQVQPGDTVGITNARRSYTNKSFEVAESSLLIRAGSSSGAQSDDLAPELLVEMVLRETDSAVFNFDESTEETQVPAAPTQSPLDPTQVGVPQNVVVTSGSAELFLKGDGTVMSRMKVAWGAALDEFVNGYEVQFKKSADADFQPATNPGAELFTFIFDVEDGVAYDARVRSVNQLGVRSAFVTVTNHTVLGKSAPPANVTGFSAQQNGALVVFKWDQVADLDVAGYEIRFGPIGSFSWGSTSILVKRNASDAVTDASAPPGANTFAIKALDTSGNESVTETTVDLVVTNENDIIFDQKEHPRWAGTRTGFVKHHLSGRLVPDSKNIANTDGVFAQFVRNPIATAIYEAPQFDLGFDASGVRVFAEMKALLGPGETTGVADPLLEIDFRKNADAFGGFQPWTVGTINARFIKTRAKIVTATGLAYLEEFKPTFDVAERTEKDRNVTVAIGGTTITFAERFHQIPSIQVTASGTSARFPMHSAESVTGFTITVFDVTGADVGGTVDWDAIGI